MVRLQCLVAKCSFQDADHKGNFILDEDLTKVWQVPSGTSAGLIELELERASFLSEIRVINYGSAFVQIDVAHPLCKEEDYRAILPTSALMSVSESKKWEQRKRLLVFGKDKLTRRGRSEKWERVRIKVQQPFAKDKPYGLSLVQLFGELPVVNSSASAKSEASTREDSDAAPILQFTMGTSMSSAETGKAGSAVSKVSSRKLDFPASISSRNLQPKATATTGKDRKGSGQHVRSRLPSVTRKKVNAVSPLRAASQKHQKDGLPAADAAPESRARSVGSGLSNVLRGVTLVISGIVNPERSQLRGKLLAMGGRYSPTWTPKCTHLVSDFANTPKVTQALQSKGIVVSKQWLLDCYQNGKRAPEKGYLLIDESETESSAAEDEQEEDEESEAAFTDVDSSVDDLEDAPATPKVAHANKRKRNRHAGQIFNAEGQNDEEEDARQAKRPRPQTTDKFLGGLVALPDFLKDVKAFLYGFGEDDKNQLVRILQTYGGEESSYLEPGRTTHCVTSKDWNDDMVELEKQFDNKLKILRPDWLIACHREMKLVEETDYIIAPR